MACVLTVVASREATVLTAAAIGRVRDAVGGGGAPVLLSPGEAADIPGVGPGALAAARAALEGAPVDVLLTREQGRRRRLVVADMDGTVVAGETLDELAAQAGLGEAVAAITRRSMNGEVDFAAALRARVALLRGLELAALERTWRGTALTDGARTLVDTMRAHGARTVLVSGGFTFFTARVARRCGFDAHRANELEDDGARLTGQVREPVLDRDAKLAALREFAGSDGLRLEECLALGDGANDLAMLRQAGLSIAYRPKPVVAAAIANRLDHANLRGVLFAQGYTAAEFAS